jgi:uncharacterized membrane protein
MKDMNLADLIFQKKFNAFDIVLVFVIGYLWIGGFYLTGIIFVVVFALVSNSLDAWYAKDKARRDNSDQWGHE